MNAPIVVRLPRRYLTLKLRGALEASASMVKG
jgi:hypothetical protein